MEIGNSVIGTKMSALFKSDRKSFFLAEMKAKAQLIRSNIETTICGMKSLTDNSPPLA
jgi:hypothetical protein